MFWSIKQVCWLIKKEHLHIYIYTWNEAQAVRGSNKVISALDNFLKRIRKHIKWNDYTKLALFFDSCVGQNKNKTMLMYLLRYINFTSKKVLQYSVLLPYKGA